MSMRLAVFCLALTMLVGAAWSMDDKQAAQAAFLDLGQACKNCHDEFREETD